MTNPLAQIFQRFNNWRTPKTPSVSLRHLACQMTHLQCQLTQVIERLDVTVTTQGRTVAPISRPVQPPTLTLADVENSLAFNNDGQMVWLRGHAKGRVAGHSALNVDGEVTMTFKGYTYTVGVVAYLLGNKEYVAKVGYHDGDQRNNLLENLYEYTDIH
jgi:hypothetical protein